MIRVLIVDHHPIVRDDSELYTDLNFDILSVKTGTHAEVLVPEFEPDIALIDSDLPDMEGIELVRWLQISYSTKAILFLNQVSDQTATEINQAIDAGVKGILLKSQVSESLLKNAIAAVHRDSSFFLGVGLDIFLRSSVSAIVVAQQADRVTDWANWLASEVIGVWRKQPVPFSVETCVQELGLTSKKKSFPELITNLTKSEQSKNLFSVVSERAATLIQQQQNQQKPSRIILQEMLMDEEKLISRYFSLDSPANYIDVLRINADEQRATLFNTINKYCRKLLGAGSLSGNQWLEALIARLREIQPLYNQSRETAIQTEMDAMRSYRILCTELSSRQRWLFGGYTDIWKGAVLSLSKAYYCRLEAESYTRASSLIGDAIQKIYDFMGKMGTTDALLSALENQCIDRSSTPLMTIPLLRDYYLERVNPAELRATIEGWAGHSLLFWGRAEQIQLEPVYQQLLSLLRPIAADMYLECCETANKRQVLDLLPIQQNGQALMASQQL
jgi:DNA-binding NarL/FixJ family response regulator